MYEDRFTQTLVGIAASGLAVAFVPSSANRLRIPGAIYCELDPPIPITDVALVWNENTRSKAVLQFLEIVEEMFPQ